MTKEIVRGVWPVMLTPFLENGEIDVSGLERLTDFYLDAGVTGLFANCLSSEMFELSPEERLKITDIVVQRVHGKVPVVSTGTFGSDSNSNASFIKSLQQIGVEAIVVNTNQLVGADESDDQFKLKVEKLLSKTGSIPLGLYECPVPYKRLLSPRLVKWLAGTERFLYLKDTSCDINAIDDKLDAIRGTAFGLFNAHTPTGLESLRHGASGLSAIGANYYPELFTQLIRWMDKEDKAGQLKETNEFLCKFDAFIHLQYPLASKRFLQKRGLQITDFTRTKILNSNALDETKQDYILKEFIELTDRLQIRRVV